MLLLLEELLFSLRRDGLEISTAQALTAARALLAVGFEDRVAVQRALAASVVSAARDRPTFDRAFARFFSRTAAHANDLWHRLRVRGFSDAEIDSLRSFVGAAAERSGDGGDGLALRLLGGRAEELEWLLSTSRMKTRRRGMKGRQTVGFYAAQAARELRVEAGASALVRMRALFKDAFGDERASALDEALADELASMKRRIRTTLEREVAAPSTDAPSTRWEEREAVRLAVRRLADKLEGAARLRERRARRGAIDVGRTLRRAARTAGVPLVLARRRPRRDRAKAVLVCDLSDSVRHVSSFLVEFLIAAQKLLRRTRTFVFVTDAREVTALLREASADAARRSIERGDVVPLSTSSNYGRAFTSVEALVGASIDKRTTLVVLGDGRTNWGPDGLATLEVLRGRARELLWLCPEPAGSWGQGDSKMLAYAKLADRVLAVTTPRELEDAARALVRRSRA